MNDANKPNVKDFTDADLDTTGTLPVIYADRSDLGYCPLSWQISGLSQTQSGYGQKLTTEYKIKYNGRMYRVYSTCYSNVGSLWFRAGGTRIYVR